MGKWSGSWPGGRRYVDGSGRTRWFLDRTFNGKRYGMVLDVRSEEDAMAEYALWKRDPLLYVERKEERLRVEEDRVPLTPELVEEFRRHLYSLGREEKHVENCVHYVDWWLGQFRGQDVRSIRLRDLKRALGTEDTARKNRIASWKRFCTFLREDLAVLPRGSDASLDLKTPPPRPEKAVREKGYTTARVEAVYAHLSPWESREEQDLQPVRDLVCLLSRTGMHFTEAERMARGECQVSDVEGHGEIAGVLKFVHKSGRIHVQSVDAQALAAAKRLRRRGSAPAYGWVKTCLDVAAEAAGVEAIKTGELRHSFVTWSSESGRLVKPNEHGLPLEVVAASVGHTSPNTTRRYYDGTKVKPLIVVPLRLEHPEDPPLPGQPILKLVSN